MEIQPKKNVHLVKQGLHKSDILMWEFQVLSDAEDASAQEILH